MESNFEIGRDIENYDDILGLISETNLKDVSCKRIFGFKISESETTSTLLCWQCNLADINGFDTKLPTTVILEIENANRTIKSVELKENFKGSQGMPCARLFLNRKLKEVLIGEELSIENKKIQDPLILCCRHTHELVVGAISFYENYLKTGAKLYNESTFAKIDDDGIDLFDVTNLNDKKLRYNVRFNFKKNDICMNEDGEIYELSNIKVTSHMFENGERILLREDFIENAKGAGEIALILMKVFSKLWKHAGKSFDVKRNFYFSNLWPPSIYGVFVQSIALAIHGGNYAYFQHALSGLQKGCGSPKCVGIVSDIDEALKYFPDFRIEDMYE